MKLSTIFYFLLCSCLLIICTLPVYSDPVTPDVKNKPAAERLEASYSLSGAGIHPEKIVRRVYLMGTLCTIQFYTSGHKRELNQLESLIQILEHTEKELSTWQKTSALSSLNQQSVGTAFDLNPSLYTLFHTLQYWSDATENTFDPTVGRLLKAYGVKTGGSWPDNDSLETARASTGMKFYRLDAPTYSVTKTRDVEIDSGAFGKGEALDRMLRVQTSNCSWLVDLGGQILVNGIPPGETAWEVTIAHPQNRQEGFLTISIQNGSLATSGGSERDVEVDSRRLGHIIDPGTGRPAVFDGTVSVWHEQALVADIVSTSLYVMGPGKGIPWANARNIATCFLVPDKKGIVDILTSRAFTERFLSDKRARITACF